MELTLRPWTPGDIAILLRDNTPEMTAFLGGPEPEELIQRRHERFLRGGADGSVAAFSVHVDGEPAAVGAVAYWRSEYRGQPAYEAAWAIGTPFQGHGYARRAIELMLQHAREHTGPRMVWAFPRIDNAASNALARAAGFSLLGETDAEYPKGVPIRVNEWAYDLLR